MGARTATRARESPPAEPNHLQTKEINSNDDIHHITKRQYPPPPPLSKLRQSPALMPSLPSCSLDKAVDAQVQKEKIAH